MLAGAVLLAAACGDDGDSDVSGIDDEGRAAIEQAMAEDGTVMNVAETAWDQLPQSYREDYCSDLVEQGPQAAGQAMADDVFVEFDLDLDEAVDVLGTVVQQRCA